MNHTTNLHLPQWEATDRIMMDDFNDAFDKIDTAVAAAGNCKIAYGTYTGDGQYGSAHPNTLTFDFAPKLLVMLYNDTTIIGEPYVLRGGIIMAAVGGWIAPTASKNDPADFYAVVSQVSGNTVSWYSATGADKQSNISGVTYHYVAIG